MIGQLGIQTYLIDWYENNVFPRFILLVGPKGSGRKLMVRDVIKQLIDGLYVEYGIKIEDIRNLIQDAYIVHSPTLYFIPDADTMSVQAQNAMLKIIEEPPNNSYFIMTVEDKNNVLDTIRSRAVICYMNRYTPGELIEYYESEYGPSLDNKLDIIKEVCETPGDIQLLESYNIEKFYDYVQLVVDNIAEVSTANAFKIAEKVAIKDTDTGYDIKLFLRAVGVVMLKKAKQRGNAGELKKYCDGYTITNKYVRQLRIKGVNKQMLMDNWVLEIREVWM